METGRRESRDGRALLVWRGWTYIVPVIGCVVAVAGPAMAQSPGLYDTSRILAHLGNECLGVPSCRTVESPRTTVDVDVNADADEPLLFTTPRIDQLPVPGSVALVSHWNPSSTASESYDVSPTSQIATRSSMMSPGITLPAVVSQ